MTTWKHKRKFDVSHRLFYVLMLFVYGRKEDKYSLIMSENSIYSIFNLADLADLSQYLSLSKSNKKLYVYIGNQSVGAFIQFKRGFIILCFVMVQWCSIVKYSTIKRVNIPFEPWQTFSCPDILFKWIK